MARVESRPGHRPQRPVIGQRRPPVDGSRLDRRRPERCRARVMVAALVVLVAVVPGVPRTPIARRLARQVGPQPTPDGTPVVGASRRSW
ncbi:hypothetical protein ACGFIE_07210 [Micromonospora sp. NPDC049275]|uniref:hypothetical protein n=1 Tax=Micromonospora sp. NPDC049275 TaxID=3364268 RepID=UPI003720E63A